MFSHFRYHFSFFKELRFWFFSFALFNFQGPVLNSVTAIACGDSLMITPIIFHVNIFVGIIS